MFFHVLLKQCGLVLVMGLITKGKEGSTPVGILHRFLSSAPLPNCHHWEAWQSSALGDEKFFWLWRGALRCLCAFGYLTQSWDRISERCPALSCQSSAVPGMFVLHSVWEVRSLHGWALPSEQLHSWDVALDWMLGHPPWITVPPQFYLLPC